MAVSAFFLLGIAFNAIHYFGIQVQGMIKIDGLRLFGIEHHGKDDPSHNQSAYDAQDKESGVL
jgi:hypothetical protein